MAAALRLSVLDQSPVPSGSTPADALANSLDLAKHVDRLGYTRLWYSEHHAMEMLACTAPEILITRAAAATERIRVGSGGVMLPHYSAFKVAEVFRTLHAMFPGRIDLGIGRAPGGGQLESYALRRNRQGPQPDDFPQQLAELQAYLHPERFRELGQQNGQDHPFRNVLVSPAAPGAPDVWLLGSSMWSAVTAANEGLPYAYAHFFSAQGTRQAIEYYQRNFQPSRFADDGLARRTPEATLAIGVICAPTQDEADHLHASVRLLQRRIRTGDRRPVATPEDALRELNAARPEAPNPFLSFTAGSFEEPDEEWPRYVIGTPDRVAARLRGLADDLHLNELIINTITHSHEARLRSYALLATEMNLSSASPAATLAAA
ncbi:MAG: LLM class flavin-dependent oxidoreductase [Janthinobacterium lividum]